jgi:hypothetical protein
MNRRAGKAGRTVPVSRASALRIHRRHTARQGRLALPGSWSHWNSGVEALPHRATFSEFSFISQLRAGAWTPAGHNKTTESL